MMFKWLSFLLIVSTCCLVVSEVSATGPSFDCEKVESGSIEELVCKDEGLSALDTKLAVVYSEATQKAINEQPPALKAEQRGWIKGRNDCWKRNDLRKCVEEEYKRRIAELQARYRLIPGSGPISYACNDDPHSRVIVTFFQTDPPTLIAERADSVSLMYLQPCGSGTKYQGRNETFWEHHNCEALITWGYGAKEMHCKRAP